MSINMAIVGETTAKMMDSLDNKDFGDDAKIEAVAIVCVVSGEEEGQSMSFTRTFFSDTLYYQQLGLMESGLLAVRDGNIPD